MSLIHWGAAGDRNYLPVSVAMSSGEAEYISPAVAFMKTSHLRIFVYDLRFLGCKSYDGDNIKCEPSRNYCR